MAGYNLRTWHCGSYGVSGLPLPRYHTGEWVWNERHYRTSRGMYCFGRCVFLFFSDGPKKRHFVLFKSRQGKLWPSNFRRFWKFCHPNNNIWNPNVSGHCLRIFHWHFQSLRNVHFCGSSVIAARFAYYILFYQIDHVAAIPLVTIQESGAGFSGLSFAILASYSRGATSFSLD